MEQRQNRRSSLTSVHVQADTRLLVVGQHQYGQDAMFSCTSRSSKAFHKRPFQAMTFNASATNNSGLEQATVIVPLEFVVEWSNYRSANLPEMAKIRTAHQFTREVKIVKQPQMVGFL